MVKLKLTQQKLSIEEVTYDSDVKTKGFSVAAGKEVVRIHMLVLDMDLIL